MADPEGADDLVLYWDSSAILSALVDDPHTKSAKRWSRRAGEHLLSTLAYAEVMATLSRHEREGSPGSALAEMARTAVNSGPWRQVNSGPEWSTIAKLAAASPLRGADLWHLAEADSLRTELPNLQLLTYDARLAEAADAIGLGARS